MRRPVAACLAIACSAVLAACAADRPGDRRPVAGPVATTTAPGAAEEPAASEDGATTSSEPGATTTSRGPGSPRPAAPPTTGARSPGPTVAPAEADGAEDSPPAASAPTAGDDGSQGPPGAFARTLLRPEPAKTIALERYVQDGADVAATSLQHSVRVLGEVTAKPVDVRPAISLPANDRDWTADELRAAADRSSRLAQGGGRAVLRVVLVRGTFEGSTEVLGVAVRGDVVALFRDNIAASSTPVVSGRSIEEAVLLHEVGHVLGLVDLVLRTGRADPEHPEHSRNRGSVMYWAVESSLVGQVLGGGPPRDFDAADLADLRALRGGA